MSLAAAIEPSGELLTLLQKVPVFAGKKLDIVPVSGGLTNVNWRVDDVTTAPRTARASSRYQDRERTSSSIAPLSMRQAGRRQAWESAPKSSSSIRRPA